ncbi:MAG: prepilin peptidase [Desulfobulbus sp.]|jgi:prepilin peptidase CpaA
MSAPCDPHAALACLVAVTAASATDLHGRIIPNAITLPTLLGGCLYLGLTLPGMEGVFLSLTGALLGGGLLLLPYLRGMVGGGDLKLLAALGAWLGPGAVFSLFLYATVAGGLLAVGRLVQRWQRRRRGNDVPDRTIPYALAIASGLILLLFRGKIT